MILRSTLFILIPLLAWCGSACSDPSLQEVIDDQLLPHEAGPHGVDPDREWARHPMVLQGITPPFVAEDGTVYHMENPPPEEKPVPAGYFTAMIPWGHVYVAYEGNESVHARVQLRRMKAYILSDESGRWRKVKDSGRDGIEGALYDEDWSSNESLKAAVRKEAEGVSVYMGSNSGYVYHYWPGEGRIAVDPQDVAGIYVTIQARLIPHRPGGPFDPEKAHFIVNLGADWWKDLDAGYSVPWGNNAEVSFSRFKYVRQQWRTYHMICLWPTRHPLNSGISGDIIRSNPPLD